MSRRQHLHAHRAAEHQRPGQGAPANPPTVTNTRAYRVALDPTTAQVDALARHAGANRAAYNHHLAAKRHAHQVWRQAVAQTTYARDHNGNFVIDDPDQALQVARKTVRVRPPSYMDSARVLRPSGRR